MKEGKSIICCLSKDSVLMYNDIIYAAFYSIEVKKRYLKL